ncbi:prolipoprotein diacylglyceryl transferase [Patescibacteria group bacterium]|nr:prolipoprotein diacylglyceryl transferase [Patescibacteria group bacterium]
MSFQVLGLQFHLYGLLIGLAAATAILLAEKVVQNFPAQKAVFWQVVSAAFLGGLIGARVYHVWTDWPLYVQNFSQTWQIWNGGLSIIGAFIGGVGGLIAAVWWQKKKVVWKQVVFWMDVAVLCLPVAQAIGRLGNFVNQELYGLPSTLPWAIPIDLQHRVTGYQNFTTFHPLFAYEALGMLICAGLLWWMKQKQIWQLGSGRFMLTYFAWYGLFRSGLESLRIEKTLIAQTSIGFNQAVLFMIGILSLAALVWKLAWQGKGKTLSLTLMAVMLVVAGGLSGCTPQSKGEEVSQIIDHSTRQVRLSRQATSTPLQVTVEVVTTPESIQRGLSGRTEIGSDGMLFIFPQISQQVFWMKEMNFDLDMIWIADGKVVGITPNVPKPASPDLGPSQLQRYASPTGVNMVLEVPAGTAKQWQLQVGDALELP